MNHTIINWVCLDCKTYHKSDSREHHKMDNCKCGNGVDHELYYTRLLGNVKINSTKKV